MQKDQKRSGLASTNVRQRRQAPTVQPPEVVSADVLGTVLDDDLIVRLRALDDGMQSAHDLNIDTRPWEQEIAYVRREQQIRRGRRDAHAAYVRRVEAEYANSEVGLPAGDFDNSAFVYAATGGRPRWN